MSIADNPFLRLRQRSICTVPQDKQWMSPTVREIMRRRPWILHFNAVPGGWEIQLAYDYVFRDTKDSSAVFKTQAKAREMTHRKYVARPWECY